MDAALRTLVRRAPGEPHTLSAQVRAGLLSQDRVRWAAALGHQNSLCLEFEPVEGGFNECFEAGVLTDSELRLFACDCAERVLPLFERKRPRDKRPREAIEAARRFARGEAAREELAQAAAAWDAAWAVARDAARNAARAAAWAAAWAAARAAAWAAARAAAWAAARAAAWAAAWAAARAAGDAEREWQAARLCAYLLAPAGHA